MKKLFAFVVIFALILSFCALQVIAASPDILIGTAKVDGVLDEIYTESFSFTITPEACTWNAGSPIIGIKVTSYYLYDKDFLYICHVGTDDDLQMPTETWKKTLEDADYWANWENDNVENRLDMSMSDVDFICINSSCTGGGYMLSEGFTTVDFDMNNIKYATTYDIAAGTFCIELAVPIVSLKAGDSIGINNQIDDRTVDGVTNAAALVAQKGDGLVYYKLSDKEAIIVEEEPVEVVSTPVTDTSNPGTSDISLVMYIFAALSTIGGALVIKKK